MADIPTKYALLKRLLFLMGIKHVNDHTTRVFNADLKLNDTFCAEAGTLMGDSRMFPTVDSAVKMAKELMDECGVSYTCGRTSKSTFFSLSAEIETENVKHTILTDGVMYKLPLIQDGSVHWQLLCATTGVGMGGHYVSQYRYLKPDEKKSTAGRLVFELGPDYIDHLGLLVGSFTPNESLSGDMHQRSSTAELLDLIKSMRAGSLDYKCNVIEQMSDAKDVFLMNWNAKQPDPDVVKLSVGKTHELVIEYDTALAAKTKFITVMGRCIDVAYEPRKNGRWIKQPNPLIGHEIMISTKPCTGWSDLGGFDYIKSIHFKEMPEHVILSVNNQKIVLDKNLIWLITHALDQHKRPQGYALSLHFYHESFGGMQSLVTARLDNVKLLATNENGASVEFVIEAFDNAVKLLLARTPEDYVREMHRGAVIIEQKKLELPLTSAPAPVPVRCKRLFYLAYNSKSAAIQPDYIPPIIDFLNLKIKRREQASHDMCQFELVLNKEIVWIFPYDIDGVSAMTENGPAWHVEGFFFYEPETSTLEEQLVDAVKNGVIQEFDDCVARLSSRDLRMGRIPTRRNLLDVAIEHGQKDMIEHLSKSCCFEYSSWKIITDDFQRILNTVAKFGRTELLQYFVDNKPKEFDFTRPNQETFWFGSETEGWNSLHYAAAGIHHDTFAALIRLGVPVLADKNGQSPHDIMSNGLKPPKPDLLQAAADLEKQDYLGGHQELSFSWGQPIKSIKEATALERHE